MKNNITLSICLLLWVCKTQVSACICYHPIGFDLVEYDNSENIIEILIKEEISELPENVGDNIEVISDEVGYQDFNAYITHVFKGKLSIGDLNLRATDLGTNCEWTPKTGEKYIIYTRPLLKDSDKTYVLAFGCQRHVLSSSKRGQEESFFLKAMSSTRKGKFKIALSNLGQDIPPLILVEGHFKRGKRHGSWKLYDPYFGESKVSTDRHLTLELTYKKGILIHSIYFKPEDYFLANFSVRWKSYYYK